MLQRHSFPTNRFGPCFALNGNRTEANEVEYGATGPDNRLTTDGYYTYIYDAEGNLKYRLVDGGDPSVTGPNAGDTKITTYTWDWRDRLTKVQYKTAYGQSASWWVEYAYDVFNRRVSRNFSGSPTGRDGGRKGVSRKGSRKGVRTIFRRTRGRRAIFLKAFCPFWPPWPS